MTTPRHPRTLPALLALGLVAVVALPAASALQLASAGNAAADAAWSQAATLGGAGCIGEACTAQYHETARLANAGSMSASASYDVNVETHEREAVEAAVDAAEELRAEAEAKLREALALRERVHADVRADADVQTRGDAEAAWDSEADLGGDLGVEGILTLGGGRHFDLEREERIKHQTEAKVRAEGDSAVQLITDLLAELQGHLTMTVEATFGAVADAGAAVGGALGLVQNTDVNVHHELDASVGLGAVPRVDVPDLRPDVGMAGSASLAAQAQAAASGLVRN